METRNATTQELCTLRPGIFYPVARQAILDHGDAVAAELEVMARMSERSRAQYAMVFALVSPRLRFASNVAVAAPLLRAILAGETDAGLIAIMRAHRVYLGMTHRAIIFNRDRIANASRSDFDRKSLMRGYGFGPKTSALACALFDPHARSFTLDVWMFRGIFHVAGIGTMSDNWIVNLTQYRTIEAMFLDIADELSVSPFLLQWSLWNVWRRNANEHTVHTDMI